MNKLINLEIVFIYIIFDLKKITKRHREIIIVVL